MDYSIPIAVGAAIIVITFIVAYLIHAKNNKVSKEVKAKPDEQTLPTPEPEYIADIDTEEDLPIVERHVRVIDMKCTTEMRGYQEVKCYTRFLVLFEDDNGERFELYVSESLYLYISRHEDERGTIAFVNGELFDYVSDFDETCTEEE